MFDCYLQAKGIWSSLETVREINQNLMFELLKTKSGASPPGRSVCPQQQHWEAPAKGVLKSRTCAYALLLPPALGGRGLRA